LKFYLLERNKKKGKMCHNNLLEEALTEKENWADIEGSAEF